MIPPILKRVVKFGDPLFADFCIYSRFARTAPVVMHAGSFSTQITDLYSIITYILNY